MNERIKSNTNTAGRNVRSQLYRRYSHWKSWSDIEDYKGYHRVFSKEIRRAGVPPGSTILEIGFGQGLFLDWGAANGFKMVGVDIVPEFVEAAKRRGHDVYCGELKNVMASFDNQFDLIVIFDVLEHMTLDEIVSLFKVISRILKNNGRIIARFPNGASPFDRAYQYGDATHQTVLTGPKISQIAALSGLELLSVHNAIRFVRPERAKILRLCLPIASLLRDVFQLSMGLIYFGKNIPLDPNMSVVIKKSCNTRYKVR